MGGDGEEAGVWSPSKPDSSPATASYNLGQVIFKSPGFLLAFTGLVGPLNGWYILGALPGSQSG